MSASVILVIFFVAGSFCHAFGGKLFTIASFSNKLGFECGDLVVQQVVCLVYQADDGVGAYCGICVFQPWGV